MINGCNGLVNSKLASRGVDSVCGLDVVVFVKTLPRMLFLKLGLALQMSLYEILRSVWAESLTCAAIHVSGLRCCAYLAARKLNVGLLVCVLIGAI